MKAHFFVLNGLISIICFLTTFKLACDTNNIHNSAASGELHLSAKSS